MDTPLSLSARWGERAGPGAQRWEGEGGERADASGIPHLALSLSHPGGGEGFAGGVGSDDRFSRPPRVPPAAG